MRICRRAADVVVHTPAKLNLFFEVLAKRSDGYHEIETLMYPIDLYDTLYFTEEPGGKLELNCERVPARGKLDGSPVDDLPLGSDNLVVRALELLRARAGVRCGARVRLIKRIPTAAGLGGGSSDAAAALTAANLGWHLDLSPGRLATIAADLGSDVPFFLVGGPAVCRGRGEIIEPLPHSGVQFFVVVRPPVGLSTAEVYAVCRPVADRKHIRPLLTAVSRGCASETGRLLFNRLQSAAVSLSPWIDRLRGQFEREDVLGHAMSGSGTAYFGLCRHAKHAKRVARRLEANGVGSVFAVRSCR